MTGIPDGASVAGVSCAGTIGRAVRRLGRGRPRPRWALLLRRIGAAVGLHIARRRDHVLIPRSIYSPVPDIEELDPAVWDRRSSLAGIALDLDRQMHWAESRLAAFAAELDAPARPTGRPGEFFFENGYYETGDAEIAYAIVRHLKPAQIIELGSGYSTLVLARACVANARDGDAARLEAFSPHPTTALSEERIAGLTAHYRTRAQDLPLDRFTDLDRDDVLFVDTSHTVKLGGDVNFIVLEVLPRLRPGVVVHFHDVWLPWEYHRVLFEVMEMYWNEQYLLQAFLTFNPAYEVVFATQAIARQAPRRLERLLPRYESANFPTSFWIRRTDAPV